MSVAYQSSTSSHFSPVRSRDYSPWMTSPEASLEDGCAWEPASKSSFPSSSPPHSAYPRRSSPSSQPSSSSSDDGISPMILLYPSIPLILFLGTLAGAFV